MPNPRPIMQIIISVTMLSACLYLLIAQPIADLRQWAAAINGSNRDVVDAWTWRTMT